MIRLASQERWEWKYGALFMLLAFILLGLQAWLQFGELAQLDSDIQQEQLVVQNLKGEQEVYFDSDLGAVLARYSDSIQGIESLLYARDKVFTGLMSEDRFEPVVLLEMRQFFELLQRLLSQQVLVNNFSISPTGRVSFLVRTTSYSDAARQMDALRFGLQEDQQQDVLNEDSEGATLPQLFSNVLISNVSRTELSSSLDALPAVLQGREASYDFVVQMDINPEYFVKLNEQRLLSE